MSDKDGGLAFPGGVNSVYTNIDEGCPTQEGMTLRDYFAAKAMQAWVDTLPYTVGEFSTNEDENALLYSDDIAWRAYLMADAMLAAREAK